MPVLSQLKPGQKGTLVRIAASPSLKRRLCDLGLTPGVEITLRRKAPLGDPLSIRVRGYDLSIRKSEADRLLLEQGALKRNARCFDDPPTNKSRSVSRRIPIRINRPDGETRPILALVGNPNCGKTTLFNALTGSRQYVGNWPGVTVQAVSAFTRSGKSELWDLPGIYSLSPYSMEEAAARDFLLGKSGPQPSAILNIVDGTNLERNLSLTLQLLELGLPMVVAVNLMDEVQKRGWTLDCGGLSEELGVPVIPISARTEQNLELLLQKAETVARFDVSASSRFLFSSESDPETAANIRFDRIGAMVGRCLRKPGFSGRALTDRIDAVILGKWTAFPLFLALLGGMFALTFGATGRFFSQAIRRLFFGLLAPWIDHLLMAVRAPEWCGRLMLEGVLGGMSSVLVFLPQIAILFLCLSLLEDSGYMARAAFLTDRLLHRIGLTGRSFIPMLMGFGCTTPAVLAARGMDNERDRRRTILLIPFMSCSARLPIYAIFAGTFFPRQQGGIVAGLYLLGILVAIGVGRLLKKAGSKVELRGESTLFLMELPPYRMPSMLTVTRHVWERVRGFLVKAGTLIFALSLLVWAAREITPTLRLASDPADSLLGCLGRWIAPLLTPLGFGNWQSAVALLTGLVAKESVVGSLAVLYANGSATALPQVLNGVFTSASALSFLAFSLLYMPCISAFSTIVRETDWKWGLHCAGLQCGTAYAVAFAVYQLAKWLL